MTVSQTFLVFDNLDCFEDYLLISYFVECPSVGIFQMFLIIRWVIYFGEEDHRDKVLFSSHLIKGSYYLHDL